MTSSDHTGDHHGSGSFPASMHQYEIKRLLDDHIHKFGFIYAYCVYLL